MAITKLFRNGVPSDDAEITEAVTDGPHNMEGGSGLICAVWRIEAVDESVKIYDIKQAFSYALGTWQVITDSTRDSALIDLRIVVTNAAGAQLRIIHDFGTVTIGVADDVTFTANNVAQQDLLATERLAVFYIHNDVDEPRHEGDFDNFSAACNSRLVTPDEVVGLTDGERMAAIAGGDVALVPAGLVDVRSF